MAETSLLVTIGWPIAGNSRPSWAQKLEPVRDGAAHADSANMSPVAIAKTADLLAHI